MKYINDEGDVRTLIIDQHPFKKVDNCFSNALLCQDSLEADPRPKEFDSGNEAAEPGSEDECP